MNRILLAPLLALAAAASAEPASMLLYDRSEAGVENYASRYIATARYLRLDMGRVDDNFVLFDREARTIYSVVHGDKTIAVIESRAIEGSPPMALKLREERVALPQAPTVAGRAPVQQRLYSGERLCLEVVAVPGLLGDAVAARREMAQVLAADHAATLPAIPADLHDTCDLAINTFHADWITRFGLPIREQDFTGAAQMLVDYAEKFDAEAALFRLPEGYQRYSVSSMKQ